MNRPRIVITRALHQASELAERLRELGAEPVVLPSIELVPPSSFAALDRAMGELSSFHWLLFTSANAVEVFAQRLPAGVTSLPPIAAIGQATARAVERAGWQVELLPEQAVAESFVEALLPLAQQPDGSATRFLLVRAEQARDVLPEALAAARAEVVVAPAYATVIPEASRLAVQGEFAEGGSWPDAIAFTSSSTARHFVELLSSAGVEGESLAAKGMVLASIGPITSATMRELGLPPTVEASEATVASLARVLGEYLRIGKLDDPTETVSQ